MRVDYNYPTVRMSNYYRAPQKQAYNWREREAEASRKKADEEQRKKNVMNETNFPTLSTARPAPVQTGNKYANLAQQWAVDDKVEKQMESYKKFRESADRIETNRVMLHRMHHHYDERHEEDYEEDLATGPSFYTSGLDDSGWEQVKRKTYKGPRELSVEEMDEKARKILQSTENTSEFNSHLLESDRHDHHRV